MSRGHIYKRGDSWTIIYELESDFTGKRRQKSKGGFSTKKKAQQALVEVLHQQDTGGFVEPKNLTLGVYLDEWLVGQKPRLAKSTFEGYEVICRVHLKSSLGNILLQKLGAARIEKYYAAKRDLDNPPSEKTLLNHHRVLRKALDRAVKLKYVSRNAADLVESPKPKKKGGEGAMHALTPEQTAGLLDLFGGTRWEAPVLTAVATGLRRGELLGLKWSDLDLDGGYLFVNRSLENRKKGEDAITAKEPKTKSSRRKISLPKFLIQRLLSLKAEQARIQLQVGGGYYTEDAVFPDINGGWINPGAFTAAFRARIRGTKFEGVRLHDLRHTHASQLLLAGTHPKVVSDRLGHSSIAITLDTYSHLLPRIDEEAANKIDELLGSSFQM